MDYKKKKKKKKSHSKAQFEIFYNLLTAPQTVSNTYAQVAKAQLGENHVQHIERLSQATCCVPVGTKGQLSYQIWQELKSHLSKRYFTGWNH